MKKRGRPTKYKKIYCKRIIKYFDIVPYYDEEVELKDKKGNVYIKTVRKANDLPTLAGFARSIGVWRQRLLDWSKKYPEFAVSYKKAHDLQYHILVTNGLLGLYNTAFAIFTAKNVTDMRDKTDFDVTSKGKQVVAWNYLPPVDGKSNPNNKTGT